MFEELWKRKFQFFQKNVKAFSFFFNWSKNQWKPFSVLKSFVKLFETINLSQIWLFLRLVDKLHNHLEWTNFDVWNCSKSSFSNLLSNKSHLKIYVIKIFLGGKNIGTSFLEQAISFMFCILHFFHCFKLTVLFIAAKLQLGLLLFFNHGLLIY